MFIIKNQKIESDAGFFEKNFLKLKSGKLWEYIISRAIMSLTGVTLGMYFIRDAVYVHSVDGVPHSVIFVVAIIFFMNGVRKMVWGFIKLRDAAWDNSVVEKPHHPTETVWQRIGLRFPIGQRRHLVSVMALLAEALAFMLLLSSLVSKGINEHLFELSLSFPFVLKPFAWSNIELPVNLWEGLLITSGALLISYINNSLFITKIPQVRKSIFGTAERMLSERSMLKSIGLELVGFFDRREAGKSEVEDAVSYSESIARMVLALHRDVEPTNKHYNVLLNSLVTELNRNEYAVSSIPLLLRFVDNQLVELKRK